MNKTDTKNKMKTIFMTGMTVFDSVNFPDEKGKVIDVCDADGQHNYVRVAYGKHYD